MLKIETTLSTPTEVAYRLCGALTAEGLPTLRELLDECARARRSVTLDLAELTRADRDCVELLTQGPGRRARIVNCPASLKDWCRAEQDRKESRGRGSLLLLAAALWSAKAAAGQELTLSLSDAVARALSDGTAARIASRARGHASAQSLQGPLRPAASDRRRDSGGNESINFATYGFPTPPGTSPVVGPFNVLDFQVSAAMQIVDVAAKKRYDAARQGVAVSEVDARRTENDVAAAVATLYVSLQRAEASIETARANVELFTKLGIWPRTSGAPASPRGRLDARGGRTWLASSRPARRRKPARRGAPGAPPRDWRRSGDRSEARRPPPRER